MPTFRATGATSTIVVIGASADGRGYGRRSAEAAVGTYAITAAFFVDEHNHPDADGTSVAEKRRAVDPARPSLAFAIFVWTCEPANLGSNTTAFTQRSRQVGTNARRTANAVEEGRLEDTRYA